MKKLIAFLLIVVMVMSFAACGPINEKEVAILWSGDGVVKVPNSLINSMERAMYIENITYAHYGANGDQATQTSQAAVALNSGCTALVVELIDATAAQAIVDAAKVKDVPVVFFNCDVDSTVLSYEKCVLVTTEQESLSTVQSAQIVNALANMKKKTINKDADRNGDGKLTFAAFGNTEATVTAANFALTSASLPTLEGYEAESIEALVAAYTEENAPVDLIITDSDMTAQTLLIALQAKGYNKDRLKTHMTPIFTVGDTVDYKALVLSNRPAGAHSDDNVQDYFKSMQYFVDLRTVEEAELDSLICTTSYMIGKGRISGTVLEDYDGIAVQVAAVLRQLMKEDVTFTASSVIKVPYTAVSAG